MMEDTVRWSLKVSRETDEALRAHLGRAGGRKGDLSRFVQERCASGCASRAHRAGSRGGASGQPRDLARALQDSPEHAQAVEGAVRAGREASLCARRR
jgi:hypothetical protein